MALPKTTQERIKADAKKAYPISWQYQERIGYIAGATAENERALPVIYLLTEIKSAYGDQFTNHHNEMIEQTLQQWNAGKEVEKEKEPLIPIAVYKQQGCNVSNSRQCPHCGKELYRDRNLCCWECGKEVEEPKQSVSQPDLGICKECKTRPATTDYNGHQYYVCKLCDDSLNREFDEEYR